MALFGGVSGDKRPVFLDLTKIYLPRTALVSILHRVSGVAMILSLPLLLWLFYLCLDISQHDLLLRIQSTYLFKVFIFLVISGYAYHWLAGLRHLIADAFDLHGLALSKITADSVLVLWLLWSLYVFLVVWL